MSGRLRAAMGRQGSLTMVANDSHLHAGVIVVGDQRDPLVNEMVRLAQDYELEVIRCDDVYSAVTPLAKRADRCFMVVGALGELTREEGRFFALARESGARCCCLLDTDVTIEREKVLAAVRMGAYLVGQTEEMRELVEGWLAAEGCHPGGTRAGPFLNEDFRATEAELRALLEPQVNE